MFVFLSMTAAIFYQTKFSIISSQTQNIVRKIASVSLNSNPKLIGKTTEVEKCPEGSLLYQNEFKKMPVFYSEKRSVSYSDFPRHCITRVLNLNQPNLSEKKCTAQKSLCVTDEYVNVIYNLYSDVFTCLDLPQREMLPWFLVTSGFHLNAKNGISGLHFSSELAKAAILKSIDVLKNSDDPICVRLAEYAKVLKFDNKSECYEILPPENPLLSFLYFAQKYREVMQMIKQKSGSSVSEESLHLSVLQELAGDRHIIEEMRLATQNLNRSLKEGTCVSESLFSY